MSVPEGSRVWALGPPEGLLRTGQIAFAGLYAWKVAEASLDGQRVPGSVLYCILAALALWLVALAVPWSRAAWWLPAVLIGADFVLIGLATVGPPGASVVIVLLPAVGLPLLYGARAVLLVGAATVLLVSVPTLLRHGPTTLDLVRAGVVPLVALASAMIAARARGRIIERQRTIAHQHRELEALLDTADVGLVVLDAAGEAKTFNRRQRAFIDLVYPDGLPSARQPGFAFAEDGCTPLPVERFPSVRAMSGEEFDGMLIWCGADPSTRRAASVSSRIVWDEEGHFGGAVMAFNDVTDLVRALQVKDEFVASVSHELRTPLTSIAGYLELLGEDTDAALGPQARRQLDVVVRNTERLRRLVSDLLLTASTDLTPPWFAGTVDLVQMARRSIDSAAPVAARAQVVVELVAPVRLTAAIDPESVARILDNLISNGIKYTLPGGSVRVQVTAFEDGLELIVSDTGTGISEADLSQVFTRFFRAEDAQERRIGGVGLGLSIVKHVIDQHHGEITVSSKVGVGSTFRLHLPGIVTCADPDPTARATYYGPGLGATCVVDPPGRSG